MEAYNFEEKLKQGKLAEAELDAFFSDKYDIEENPIYDSLGFDRVFTCKLKGFQFSVEYKADYTAHRTGNIYIETVSVCDGARIVPGWAYTSKAQIIVFFVPDSYRAYWCRLLDIRKRLKDWQKQFDNVEVPNEGYVGKGVVVPILMIKQVAKSVYELEP